MSKRSLILALTLALVAALVLQPVAMAAEFTDVQGHPDANDINFLHDMDIVRGDPDGRVRPNDPITRAEFVALLLRAEDIPVPADLGAAAFEDVPASHWAYGYVQVAKAQGITNGVDATHFGVAQNVTREQAIAMIMRSGKALELDLTERGNYTDVEASRWSAQVIGDATQAGIIDADVTSFRPGEPASRGEVMTMLVNMLAFETKADFLVSDDTLIQAVQNYETTSAKVFNAGYPFDWPRLQALVVGANLEALNDAQTGLYDALGAQGVKWNFSMPVFSNAAVMMKAQHIAIVNMTVGMKVDATGADGTTSSLSTTKTLEYQLRLVDGTWKIFKAGVIPQN